MAEEKYNFTTKLHRCCSTDKDEMRQWAKAVHFIGGFAYASDTHVMVKTSLEYQRVLNPENLDGKSIHRDNFKEILKFEIVECHDDGVSCRNSDGQIAFYEYFNVEGNIPNFESVIPPLSKLKDISMIGINPKYMSMVADAMYSDDGVYRLRFSGAGTAILIDTIGFSDQIGILMPSLISESIF